MDAQVWKRAKAILADALELPAADQAAYLDEHCPDPELRHEVDALLRQSDDGFLRSLAILPGQFVEETEDDEDEDQELPAGASIGRYVVVEALGQGGMGRVYLATDSELHRKVAIKCLTAREPEHDLRRKLLAEARSAGRINHPNIATVYDIVEHDARTYLVMEYVEGETLASELRRERMALPRILTIGRELASALGAAHAKGIVHRDLKPANVQVMRSGSAKVLDFGVAQARSVLASDAAAPADPLKTATRAFGHPGTPAYMSPEQLHGDDIDHRSDIYSLGVVLYEMSAGHRPFASSDPLELIVLMSERLLRPNADNPEIPPDVSDAIAKALAIDPAARYQTAAEFEEALADLSAKYAPALPGRAAAAPRSWRLRAVRAAATISVVVLFVWFLGYLETGLFNETLGRTAPFDRESPWVWLQVGRQSIVPVFVYASLLLFALWAGKFALSALRLSRRVDQLLTSGEKRTRDLSSRLGFDDPLRFAQACAAFGIIALGAVFWRYSDVVNAFMTHNISTMPLERVLPLQPGHRDDTTDYRVVLTILMLVFGFMAYRVAQIRARHPRRQGVAALVLVLLPLAGAVYLGVLPHRILFSTNFERIDYAGERCYVLGASSNEALIHCPDWAPPRNRVVALGDPAVHRSGIIESVFAGPTSAH